MNDIYIVGSGASLYGFDFEKLRNKTTITVNHAYDYVPEFDYCVFLDRYFLKELSDEQKERLKQNASKFWNPIRHGEKNELGINFFRPTRNHTGNFGEVWGLKQSGLAAISFALSLNPSHIYLLGMDCDILTEDEFRECCIKNGVEYPGRMVHFSDKDRCHRYREINKKSLSIFRDKADFYYEFSKYKHKITNLSKFSRIKAFPIVPHWDHFGVLYDFNN